MDDFAPLDCCDCRRCAAARTATADALRAERDKLRAVNEVLRSEVGLLRAEADRAEEERARYFDQVQALRGNARELEASLCRRTAERESLRDEVGRARAQLRIAGRLPAENDALRARCDTLEAELSFALRPAPAPLHPMLADPALAHLPFIAFAGA